MKKLRAKKKRQRITRPAITAAAGLFVDLHRMVIDALLYDVWEHKQWQLEQILEKLGFDPVAMHRRYGYDRGVHPCNGDET